MNALLPTFFQVFALGAGCSPFENHELTEGTAKDFNADFRKIFFELNEQNLIFVAHGKSIKMLFFNSELRTKNLHQQMIKLDAGLANKIFSSRNHVKKVHGRNHKLLKTIDEFQAVFNEHSNQGHELFAWFEI